MTTLPSTEPTVWPRRRLITLLAGIAMTGLCLLAGLALAVFYAVVADTPHLTLVPAPLPTDPAQPERGEQARDAIAAEPMLPVQAADARETATAVQLAPGIRFRMPRVSDQPGSLRGSRGRRRGRSRSWRRSRCG